jgi:hypothetical protein
MIKDRKQILDGIMTSNVKSSEKYLRKNHPELYSDIINHFNQTEIKEDIIFKEKIWLWAMDLKETPKCRCGKSVIMYPKWYDGYRRNCSVACSISDPIRIEKSKQSVLDKYGSENYLSTEDYREKVRKSNMEKWGVDHYSKTEEYKVKSTNLEKYGVDHYSKTDDFIENVKKTSMEKWGVDNYAKTDDFKSKQKITSMEKWGVDNYSKTEEYKEKTINTNNSKYGIDYYIKTEDFKEKSKNTSIEKWGVDHYSKTEEYKQKVKETNLTKWGKESFTQTEEYLNKRRETNLERYGTIHPVQSEIIRNENYKISQNQFYIKYLSDCENLFRCDCGLEHEFQILTTTYYSRLYNSSPLCTICYPVAKTPSFKERALSDFISGIYDGDIIESYRDKFEIDIYLPEIKIGFEFNGLYWHSENKKGKKYHLDKTKYFESKGIRIVHIWEDDWFNKNDISKSLISNLISKTNNKIFARKCQVRKVNSKDSRKFLDDNHILGFANSKEKIGLFYGDTLVSLMTFDRFEGRKKMNDGEWNLNRFCSIKGYSIPGAASKLLSWFTKEHTPKRIVSYADRDWSDGSLYFTLGFNKISETPPDYKYVINKKRVHKSKYRKSNLIGSESESIQMKMGGIDKIWDCGKIKFEIFPT